MSRNRGSGSGPFLMEMVIAAGFFMLCVAICVSAFVRADHLSRVGQDVNHGVLAAESLVERVKAGYRFCSIRFGIRWRALDELCS